MSTDIFPSALTCNPGDQTGKRAWYPVIGIVVNVFAADNTDNASTQLSSCPDIPIGPHIECEVQIVQGYSNEFSRLPNVVVLPRGASGIDNFCEEVPRGCSQSITGKIYDGTFSKSPPNTLDGDWCVVGFIGGDFHRPVMLSWWPHPANDMDSTTSGIMDNGLLDQGNRMFRRYQGTKITITNEGSIHLDTSESNALVTGTEQGLKRGLREEGGDVQLDIKNSRRLQMNFNAPVFLGEDNPSVPPPIDDDGYTLRNPPKKDRETEATVANFDKATIELIAGEVARILAQTKNIEIHAGTKVTLVGDDGDNSIILGSDDPNECDHAVKGETFQQLMNNFITWAKNHTHTSAVGPTGKGDSILPFTQTMTATHLSQPVKVKK